MEVILCPNHNKPCSLKTGTKPGPNKGKSFYICMDTSNGQCTFVQQASLLPKSCSKHPESYVELQRLVLGKQPKEKRCYYRCADGKNAKSWCGSFDFSTKGALKDYNYQDRQNAKGDKCNPTELKPDGPAKTVDHHDAGDENRSGKVLKKTDKHSTEKPRVDDASGTSKDGRPEVELSRADAVSSDDNDDVQVIENSVDGDDGVASFHSLAKGTPKSKPMFVEGNSSFSSYRDRDQGGEMNAELSLAKRITQKGMMTGIGPETESEKKLSPIDSLSNDVKKIQINQGEDNPFMELTLDQAILRKQQLSSGLQKNKDIARKVNISSLPDGGMKLKQLIVSQANDIRKVDERLARGVIPGVDDKVQPGLSSSQAKGPQVIKVMPDGSKVMVNSDGSAFKLSAAPQVIKVIPDGSKVMVNSTADSIPRQTSILQHAIQIPPHVLQQMYAANPQAMQLYGGRMTGTRLREVSSITADALEKIHKQLESCPPETEELEDPAGIKVPLMTHQRQALAWMAWREKQTPCGGILADDMGLGKTLTMIAHVVKQRDLKSSGTDEEKSTWLNRDKEVKKLDSAMVPSQATLVVCPASLIYQWQKEIERRTKTGLLRVEMYHGANRERNICRLAKNDIVLTTYNIVGREVGAVKGEASDKPVTDEQTDMAKGDGDKPEDQPMILRIGWERIILDEAHSIKNHKCLTAMSVCKLRANFRWALTGTPIQNDLLDMYSLLRYIRCSPFDELKVWKRHVDTGKSAGTTKLNTIVRSLLLRRTKTQTGKEGKPLVELPSKTVKIYEISLTAGERKIYDRVFAQTRSTVQDYVNRHEDKEMGRDRGHSGYTSTSNPFKDRSSQSVKGGTWQSQGAGFDHMTLPTEKKTSGSELLVLLLRLRQCCCHLSLMKAHIEQETMENDGIELTLEEQMKGMLLDEMSSEEDEGSAQQLSTLFESSATSSKMKTLMSKLMEIREDSEPGHRIKSVVVSQWTKMLDIVAHHLKQVHITYSTIQGSIPAKKRIEMVEEFNTNPRGSEVMLVSLKAGGVGLNLIGGSHLFLLDNHWNPALEEQACDRIYRMGQKRDVFIHRFLCKDTIEEKIVALQKRKVTLASNVLSGSGASSQKLSLADLREMFNV